MLVVDMRGAFNIEKTIQYLHDYPVTTFCATPTVFRPLVLPESIKYLRTHSPKCLEHCVSAGEPMNPEVLRVWEGLTGIGVRDGYGQAFPISTLV
jgi:medium-chain acyl-CoA synthetase